MELNKTEAAILAGSPTVEAPGPSAAEIELYDELIIFAGLSPEEQRRMLVRPKKSGEDAVAASYSNSDNTQNASSSVEKEATALPARTISAAALSSTPAQSPSDSEDTAANSETNDVSPQLF